MQPDIHNLEKFYSDFRGLTARRMIDRKLQPFRENVKGLRLLAWGFPLPYLRSCLTAGAESVTVLMPPLQGHTCWPEEDKNLVAGAKSDAWPIETNSLDRILIIHGMGGTEDMENLLSETWRTLKGEGRLILVVPNRSGIWAWFDHTPFGHGMPWSSGQISQYLAKGGFIVEKTEQALFVPPLPWRVFLSTAPVWERMGARLFRALGGVHILEVRKKLYAGTAAPVTPLKRRKAVSVKPALTGGQRDGFTQTKKRHS